MTPSDEQCVRSCLDGHPEAFRHLVERHQTALLGHLRFRLGNRGEANEAAQETFVRAYFALGELRKPEAFFAWLFGIADRVAKETHRAAMRRRTVGWGQSEPAEPAGEPGPCPDSDVRAAVTSLPDVYREAIVLRFYGGRSCAEISRDLDVPLGTVTKRLSRAYTLLREHLGTIRRDAGNEVSP
jgi:RNA polymerase sigma-70 factor, ECF subfamily